MIKKQMIAITCGDPNGIGYEIVAKSLAKHKACGKTVIVFGATKPFVALAEKFAWARAFLHNLDSGAIDFCEQHWSGVPHWGTVREDAGELAHRTIISACNAIACGKATSLLTAPISKKALTCAGFVNCAHTEILAEFFQVQTTMLLFSRSLRIGLATTHVPISRVPQLLSCEAISAHILRIDEALRTFWQIRNPKIGVLALNPHAGENGTIGCEEIDTIEPAITNLRALGMDVCGPLVPDVAFLPNSRRKIDAYLAMFHDQGLIVLKTLGFAHGVNATLGLPILRTSPDHGTAFDIAGMGIANTMSFRSAYKFLSLRRT